MSFTILNYTTVKHIKYTMIQWYFVLPRFKISFTMIHQLLHLKILLLEIKLKLTFFISIFDCDRRSSITLEH